MVRLGHCICGRKALEWCYILSQCIVSRGTSQFVPILVTLTLIPSNPVFFCQLVSFSLLCLSPYLYGFLSSSAPVSLSFCFCYDRSFSSWGASLQKKRQLQPEPQSKFENSNVMDWKPARLLSLPVTQCPFHTQTLNAPFLLVESRSLNCCPHSSSFEYLLQCSRPLVCSESI